MNARAQAGFTLVEAAVATAIVAIAAGGALYAFAAFARNGAHVDGPHRAAAMRLANRTLRAAEDAWKYGSPGIAPAGTGIVTDPYPASITAKLSGVTPASATLAVTVRYTPDPSRDGGVVRLTAALESQAPPPGSTLTQPGLVPAPAITP